MGVKFLERLAEDAADGHVAIPLAVGRDNVPGRVFGVAKRKGVFVGSLIVVPKGTLCDVAFAKLPTCRAELADAPFALSC